MKLNKKAYLFIFSLLSSAGSLSSLGCAMEDFEESTFSSLINKLTIKTGGGNIEVFPASGTTSEVFFKKGLGQGNAEISLKQNTLEITDQVSSASQFRTGKTINTFNQPLQGAISFGGGHAVFIGGGGTPYFSEGQAISLGEGKAVFYKGSNNNFREQFEANADNEYKVFVPKNTEVEITTGNSAIQVEAMGLLKITAKKLDLKVKNILGNMSVAYDHGEVDITHDQLPPNLPHHYTISDKKGRTTYHLPEQSKIVLKPSSGAVEWDFPAVYSENTENSENADFYIKFNSLSGQGEHKILKN